MKKRLFIVTALLLTFVQLQATTIYVTPTGNSSNGGTSYSDAKDCASAISVAVAGDVILLQAGTYSIAYTTGIKNSFVFNQSGTSANPITMKVDGTGRALLDFSFPTGAWVQASYGFDLIGSYWYFYGIDITRAGYQGVYNVGGYNTFENCRFFENRNTGFEINKGGNHTTVINCDSYRNFDPKKNGSMADGFGPKQTQGPGNKFIGCRSWENSDDGFDLYDSPQQVQIIDCWTFSNGKDVWQDGRTVDGNCNGFKVGGLGAQGNHILKRCIVFDHTEKGFDQNNNTGGITFYNCVAFQNTQNYGLGGTLNSGQNHIVKNCISLNGTSGDSFLSGTIQSNNTWSSGITVSSSDFKSVDVASLAKINRNADGSLPETDLFRLASSSSLIDAGVDVGLSFSGTAPDLGAFEVVSGPMYTLSTSVNGNGTISQNLSGTSFAENSEVTLTANPLNGETFEGWTGDVVSASASITITLDGDKTITANFTSITNPISVAYVTDASGTTYANDTKILPALKSHFAVTEIDGTKSGNDYSAYDVVVISEVLNSAATGMIDLKGIGKPVLMMKVHAYKTATGTWGWCSTGYGQSDIETNIVVTDVNNTLFKDVTFVNGNEVNVLSSVVGSKGITYMDPTNFTSGSSNVNSLAYVKNNSSSISIFEIAAGSTISGTTLSEEFIQIGINSSSFANVTEDGVQIVVNACNILAGIDLTTAAMQVEQNDITIEVKADKLIVTSENDFDSASTISLYTINGQKIYSSVAQNSSEIYIPLNGMSNGVYIVSVQTISGIYTKKVVKK